MSKKWFQNITKFGFVVNRGIHVHFSAVFSEDLILMRILIIAGFADSLINFRGVLIENLISEGHEVHVSAPIKDASEGVIEKLTNAGVVFHSIQLKRTGMNPIDDLQTFFQLRKIIKHNSMDVVLAYTIKPVIWGGLATRTLGLSNFYALITGLGYGFQRGGVVKNFLSYLVKNLYTFALKNANGVIFQNLDNQLTFIEQKIVHKSQIFLVNGSGVDLAHFSKSPIPNTAKFLLIARLLKDKGIREYCEAAKIVKYSYPQAEFHLVGPEDPSPNGIKVSELVPYTEQSIIEYHGPSSDVRSHITNCSVFVLPSYHEGMPRTVLEAMAMGRPILTTNVPGCKETVLNGRNGWLVDKADVCQLSEKMMWFISNKDQWQSMGDESHYLAVEKFDVHKVNNELKRILGLVDEKNF